MKVIKRAGTVVLVASKAQFEDISRVLDDWEEMCAAHGKDSHQRRIWKKELKAIRDLRKARIKEENEK